MTTLKSKELTELSFGILRKNTADTAVSHKLYDPALHRITKCAIAEHWRKSRAPKIKYLQKYVNVKNAEGIRRGAVRVISEITPERSRARLPEMEL